MSAEIKINNNICEDDNKTLLEALLAVDFAKHFNFGEPYFEKSNILSELTGQRTFLLGGLTTFGGAIKGNAIIGFFSHHTHNTLKAWSVDQKNQAKKEFLIKRGIKEDQIAQWNLDEIDDLAIACWKTFNLTPIIATTSGSFGYACFRTIELLREYEVQLPNKKTQKLFNREEARATVWLPHPKLGILPEEKADQIHNLSEKLGCNYEYWEERDDRDILALKDALENNGFFFPTNPKSKDEVRQLLNAAISAAISNGENLLAHITSGKADLTLSSLGITYQNNNGELNFIITKPISAGLHGLMGPRLYQLEKLLKEPDIKKEKTYNQASVGATLAATVQVDNVIRERKKLTAENISLLKNHFPTLSSFIDSLGLKILNFVRSVHGTFDVACTWLADRYKYFDIGGNTRYPHNKNPVNGLGTITPGGYCIIPLDRSVNEQGSFNGSENLHIVPHDIMEIARAILLLAMIEKKGDEAQFPESAAAASIGGWLHDKIIAKEITADYLASFIYKYGIDYNLFRNLQKGSLKYINDESKTHGGEVEKFTAKFLKSLEEVSNEFEKGKNLEKRKIDWSSSITFFHTGSNGTQWASQYIKELNESPRKPKRPAPEDDNNNNSVQINNNLSK